MQFINKFHGCKVCLSYDLLNAILSPSNLFISINIIYTQIDALCTAVTFNNVMANTCVHVIQYDIRVYK